MKMKMQCNQKANGLICIFYAPDLLALSHLMHTVHNIYKYRIAIGPLSLKTTRTLWQQPTPTCHTQRGIREFITEQNINLTKKKKQNTVLGANIKAIAMVFIGEWKADTCV